MQNVLKNRNFFLLFFGTVFSNIGTTLYSFAASFYILTLTDNNAFIQGVYLAVCGVSFLLASLAAGVLADRWSKARIVFGTDYLRGAAILLSALAIYFGERSGNTGIQLAALFFIGVMSNLLGALFSPASTALLPEILDTRQLQQANSYFSVLQSVQGIAGILFAGVLYAALPVSTLFLLIGVGYVLSGFTEMFIRAPYEKPAQPLTFRHMRMDFTEGLRYMRTQSALLALIFGVLFINFFLTPTFSNVTPVFLRLYLDGSQMFADLIPVEMWQSIFSVAVSVGSLIAGLIIGGRPQKEHYARQIKRGLLFCAVLVSLQAAAFLLLVRPAFSINLYLLVNCALLPLIGGVAVSINIPVSTVLQRDVPADKLAKVMALINIGSQGLVPVASFLGGAVISLFGIGTQLTASAVGLLVTSVLISRNRSIDCI